MHSIFAVDQEAAFNNLIMTVEDMGDVALEDAMEQLGPFPDNADFKTQAIWSAKASVIYQHKGITTATLPVSREEVTSSTELTELEKATILSLLIC